MNMIPNAKQAVERLSNFNALVREQMYQVRDQYATLEAGAQLMRRHNAISIEEAIMIEAKHRVFRNEYAKHEHVA